MVLYRRREMDWWIIAGFITSVLVTTALAGKKTTICDGEQANFTCETGSYVSITLAVFGRQNSNDCNGDTNLFSNCIIAQSDELLKTLRNTTYLNGVGHYQSVTFNTVGIREHELFKEKVDACLDGSELVVASSSSQTSSFYFDFYYDCVTKETEPETTIVTTVATTTVAETTVGDGLHEDGNTPTVPGPQIDDHVNVEIDPLPMTAEVPKEVMYCKLDRVSDDSFVWAKTLPGSIATAHCPQGTRVERQCGLDGQWTPSKMMEKCFEASVEKIVDAEAATKVAGKISNDLLNKKTLNSDQISDVSNELTRFVEKVDSLGQTVDVADVKDLVRDVVKATIQISIPQKSDVAWEKMNISTAKNTSKNVLVVLDQLGDLMVRNKIPQMETMKKIYIWVEDAGSREKQIFPHTAATGQSNLDHVEISKSVLEMGKNGDKKAQVVVTSIADLGAHIPVPSRTGRTKITKEEVEIPQKIASYILSIKINDQDHLGDLKDPIVLTFHVPGQRANNYSNPRCVYLDLESVEWMTDGCSVVDSDSDNSVVCSCSHLTHFAVLMDFTGMEVQPAHAIALLIITYIGCIVSIACLALTIIISFIVSAAYIRVEMATVNQNLCICLLVAESLFLFGIDAYTIPKLPCSIIAALLHYFFLAAFAWMLLQGFALYLGIVIVLNSFDWSLYLYLFGYGMPAVIVGISLGVDYSSYGTDEYCWLSTDNYFVFSFIGPVAAVLMVNMAIYLIILASIYRKDSQSILVKHSKSTIGSNETLTRMKSLIKPSLLLLLMLGLTWVVGLFFVGTDSQNLVVAYLFTVLNSVQGLVIFLINIVFYPPVWREYRKWVRRSDWLPDFIRGSDFYDLPPNVIGKRYQGPYQEQLNKDSTIMSNSESTSSSNEGPNGTKWICMPCGKRRTLNQSSAEQRLISKTNSMNCAQNGHSQNFNNDSKQSHIPQFSTLHIFGSNEKSSPIDKVNSSTYGHRTSMGLIGPPQFIPPLPPVDNMQKAPFTNSDGSICMDCLLAHGPSGPNLVTSSEGYACPNSCWSQQIPSQSATLQPLLTDDSAYSETSTSSAINASFPHGCVPHSSRGCSESASTIPRNTIDGMEVDSIYQPKHTPSCSCRSSIEILHKNRNIPVHSRTISGLRDIGALPSQSTDIPCVHHGLSDLPRSHNDSCPVFLTTSNMVAGGELYDSVASPKRDSKSAPR